MIDIRSDAQRLRDGTIPGALRIPRNVLEWRLEPGGGDAIPELARRDRRLILVCHEGYQSSLAAAMLRRLGLDSADLIGGFCAWREQGLPVERG